MNNNINIITNKTQTQVKRLKWNILIAFVGIMAAVIIFLAVVIAQRSGDTMLKKTATLINLNTSQQVMNLDNYLEKIKTITSLFFSDEVYYQYDATSDEYDEFEKIQKETEIENRIQDLGVLENYADFAVVYANDRTVGWVSDATYKIFADGKIYSGIESRIDGDEGATGWFSDAADNHRNLFYAKRLNENSILFVSFYSREIESVFEVPKDMHDDMIVRLVDENSTVLYSNNKDEIGKELNENIYNLINANGDNMVLSKDYLVTSNKCDSNNWLVVCSIPNKIIMKEITEVKIFIYLISFGMLLLMISFGLILLNKVSNPMNQIVLGLADKAEHDLLTGLLNKMSFETAVSAVMEASTNKDVNAFVMLDMDNFKTVNDTLGHDMGDNILVRISGLIKARFGTKAVMGRLGGDEFAVFFHFTEADEGDVKRKIQSEIEILRNDFAMEFADETESCNLSLSAGIALAEYGEMDFNKMYKAADVALYKSKKNGKNRFTFY